MRPAAAAGVLGALFGSVSDDSWRPDFLAWRAERLREIEREYRTEIDELADVLGRFAAQLKATRPAEFLRSIDLDTDAGK